MKTNNFPKDKNDFIVPIEYDESINRNHIREALRVGAKCVADETPKDLSSTNELWFATKIIESISNGLIGVVLLLASGAKETSYSDEDEMRIVIMNASRTMLKHTKIRPRGSRIVGYVTYDDQLTIGSINEIVVGPAADARSEDSLQLLLQRNEFGNVKVTRSKIPYRP